MTETDSPKYRESSKQKILTVNIMMNTTPNILIADDEKEIISVLRLFLEKENMNVYEAYDGEMAYMILRNYHIDLAVIDIMMPRMNGYELLKKLRESAEIPVMILSAKVDLDDKIQGLELGADDYITKPFEPAEVTARVKAHLRRNNASVKNAVDLITIQNENVITCGDMTLNTDRCQLRVGENVFDLTKIELLLMEMFMESPKRVFTKEQIFARAVKHNDDGIRLLISVSKPAVKGKSE